MAILNPRLAIFSFSVQICAFAFSWSFRSLTAPKTVAISRLADAIIPIALMACGATLSLNDYFFSVAVSLCSVPVCYFAFKQLRSDAWRPGLAVICALILQAITSEFLFAGQTPGLTQQIIDTTALFFWRSTFCVSILMIHQRPNPFKKMEMVFREAVQKRFFILSTRAIITLLSQASLVIALSQGNRIVAWPILNSAALFSVFFSWIFLKESSHKAEIAAAIGFIAIAAFKVFW